MKALKETISGLHLFLIRRVKDRWQIFKQFVSIQGAHKVGQTRRPGNATEQANFIGEKAFDLSPELFMKAIGIALICGFKKGLDSLLVAGVHVGSEVLKLLDLTFKKDDEPPVTRRYTP